MNQDLLVEILTSAGRTLHDPTSSQNQRLQALKTQALSELESAHLLLYQQRAMQAIEVELAARETAKKDKSKQIENNDLNIIQYSDFNKNNFIENEYSTQKLFDEPKKEDPKEVAKRSLAYVAAQNTVAQDQGIARFRQRVEEIEQRGDTRTLEALLRAAHDVSITAPLHAQDFVTTFEQVPDRDQIEYATLVSQLFRDQTGGFGGNPLLSRLSAVTPRRESDLLPLHSFVRDDSSKLIDYSRLLFEEKIIQKNEIFAFRERDDDIFSRKCNNDPFSLLREPQEYDLGVFLWQVQQGMGSYQASVLSALKGNLDNWTANSSFFSELQEVYRQLGREVASEWMRTTNRLFGEDYVKGRDFAIQSSASVRAYIKDLGMDLGRFVDDYRILGKPAFSASNFSAKYEGLPAERRRAIIRDIVDAQNGDRLTALVANELPKEQVGVVAKLLPENTTNEDLLKAVERTADSYVKCKSNNVNNGIFTRRLTRSSKTTNLEGYVKAVDEIDAFVGQYIDFANEQRKEGDINLGFNDTEAQEALELYVGFLGKDFAQFRRDFQATGNTFQRLPQVRAKYADFFDEDTLKATMNYVAKKRSRDLIDDLSRNTAPTDLISSLASRLKDFGKRDVVNALVELNKTYNFLQNVGATEIISERVKAIPEGADYDTVIEAISGARRQCYSAVTGQDVEVPRGLEDLVDNVVVAYYKNTGTYNGVNIRPALQFIMSIYLREGSEKAFEAVRCLEQNRGIRAKFEQKGVNVDAYERGINRQYHLRTNGSELERIKERIQSEVEQIFDRVGQLNVEEEQVTALQQGSLREQLDAVEKVIGSYEFNDENKGFKLEIKGHIQTARSINGTVKEMEYDVDFYVSTDPLEALHMGQYFGSCLSLSKNHGGINGWASVVQVMDSNKNVIYARTSDGKHIGRNRTALTDQGVLCTRFYQNGNLYLDDAWVDYLSHFADGVRQDVMIPAIFATSGMKSKLEQMMIEGKVAKEQRTVQIDPAYFSAFHGDGISTAKSEDGRIKVDGDMYIIKTQVQPVIPVVREESRPWYKALSSKIVPTSSQIHFGKFLGALANR